MVAEVFGKEHITYALISTAVDIHRTSRGLVGVAVRAFGGGVIGACGGAFHPFAARKYRAVGGREPRTDRHKGIARGDNRRAGKRAPRSGCPVLFMRVY